MTIDRLEIGDITLIPVDDRLLVSIADQQSSARWSVAGASMAVGWLLAWIEAQQGHHLSLDTTLRELLAPEEQR